MIDRPRRRLRASRYASGVPKAMVTSVLIGVVIKLRRSAWATVGWRQLFDQASVDGAHHDYA